jgi:hypothetical protein
MELQHVNVKLFLQDAAGFDLELLIPIFHSWIQDKVFEERLLDIADYRHVHNGPGIILIGLEGDYSVDNTGGRLSVRYNRKAALDGSNGERFKQAARAALNACQRLEAELSLNGKLHFDGKNVEVLVNDRLLAPNNDAVRSDAEPDLKSFFGKLFHDEPYSLDFDSEPRRLFSVIAKTEKAQTAQDLLTNLS